MNERTSVSAGNGLRVTTSSGRREAEEGTDMGTAALGIAAVVLVVSCFLGWHANRASAANSDIKTTHTRISGYRKTRLRSGLIMLGLLVVAVLIVSALVRQK
jgi:hypothetical protein